jgi:predicted phage gp36 major capsid-like protein
MDKQAVSSNSTTLDKTLIDEQRKRFEEAEREKKQLAEEAERLLVELNRSSNSTR